MKHTLSKSIYGVAIAAASAVLLVTPAQAFKAKYYKDCYAPVKAAEGLVDKPKGDGGKKALGGLSKAAGVFGSFGGFGKAAGTVAKVQQYGGYIQDATSLASSMQEQHPDADDRWGAYGDQMGEEVDNLGQVKLAVAEAQTCYNAAYDALGTQVSSGDLKSKKAKKYLKEIKKGSMETGDLLKAALDQMRNNGSAYNEALGGETAGLQLKDQVSYCRNPPAGLRDWCAKYGSDQTALTTDAFNQAYYAGNYAKAKSITNFHHMNTLAGLGALNGAGLANVATGLIGNSSAPQAQAAAGANVQKLGANSEAYIGLYAEMMPMVETQKALEQKTTKQPW